MAAALNGVSASPAFKAGILADLGSLPQADPQLLLSRLSSRDPVLKDAAHIGLARKIRANRRKGREEENAGIFTALKSAYETAPDADLFRSIAMMSQDYSRDYLAGKSSGDPGKIIAILYADEDFSHLELTKSALRTLHTPALEADMIKALRHGLKRPGSLLHALQSGTQGDKALATGLLRVFPELAPTQSNGGGL